MKRKLIILTVLALCLVLLPALGCAKIREKCGDDTTWTLDDNGLLTISGTGEVSESPWRDTSVMKNSVISVIVESGVTSLCDYAFYECANLTSVTLPADLEEIYSGCFRFCPSLTSFSVTGEDGPFSTVDGVLYYQEYPDESYCEKVLFAYPAGKTAESFTIPSNVTNIEDFAFENCVNLKNVTLPNGNISFGVSVGLAAFCGCTGLTEITIPECTDWLDEGAFARCTGLLKVTFESMDVSIDGSAFNGCSENLTFYAYEASTALSFAKDHIIKYVTLSASTTVKDSGECGENAAWTLYKDRNLVISGTGALTQTPWNADDVKSIVVESGITSICDYAFEDSHCLTSVTFEGSTTAIGACAFQYCEELTSVTLPSELEYLENDTFYGCSSLTSLAIPPTVWQIDESVFSYCSSNLTLQVKEGSFAHYYAQKKKIKFTASSYTPKTVDSGTCGKNLSWTLNDLGILTVSGTGTMTNYNYYQSTTPWGKHIVGVQITQGVTSIGNSAFKDCSSLISVSIPSSVAIIGSYAFYECCELPVLTIPNGVTRIGEEAFNGCYNLAALTIPGSVASIGDEAFESCDGLTSVTIENGVELIGYNAFAFCHKLKDITIPGSVCSIGSQAFYNCTSLTGVDIPEGVGVIGDRAFETCRNLTSVSLPYSAKVLGSSLFDECSQNLNLTVVGGSAAQQYAIDNQIGYTVKGTGPNIVESGANGDISWTVDDTGLLTIFGSGHMDLDNSPVWSRDIQTAVIEQGIISVLGSAFSGCTLTSVTLSPSVIYIYNYNYNNNGAFSDCASLQNIYVSKANEMLYDVDGVLFTREKTALLAYPRGRQDTEYSVPNGTASINEFAFQNCANLTRISIPGSVTAISEYAFVDCSENLTLAVTLNSAALQFAKDHHINYTVISRGGEAVASGSCNNSIIWTLGQDGVLIISGKGEMPDYNAPSNTAPYLAYKDQIQAVSVQEGITRIGSYALYGLENVKEICLPDSLTSIATGAFMACYNQLTSIRIPANVTTIGKYVFNNCDALSSILVDSRNTAYASMNGVLISKDKTVLVRYPVGKEGTSYQIPDGFQTVGLGAFTGCIHLKSIQVPESVVNVENTAFILCPYLEDVSFYRIDTKYGREIFYGSENVTIHGEAGSTAEAYAEKNSIPFVPFQEDEPLYSGEWGSLTWTLTEKGKLTVSGSGTMNPYEYYSTTEWNAHKDSVQAVVLKQGITAISDYAFSNMDALTYVSIPDSVVSIGYEAFSDCGQLPDISIPASVTDIDPTAFAACNALTAINVDKDNPAYSSQDGVVFNKGKTVLFCFPAGKTGTYEIPSSVTEIGAWAFMDSAITNVRIPNTVTTIGEKAFIYSFNLTDVQIPNSVSTIGKEAFWNCNGITEITIPYSVTGIGESPFGVCHKLTAIYVDADNPNYASDGGVLFDKNKTTLLCYPYAKSGAYTVPSGVTAIAHSAFTDCPNLTGVVIPEGVTRIESDTFFMCAKLSSVTLPASLTAVDSYAFFRCYALTDIYYTGTEESWSAVEINNNGNGNEYLINAVLHTALTADLVLPSSLTAIESEAFANLPSGIVVLIPSGVTSIAEDAFDGTDGLTILGVSGSEAEAFANAHDNITFLLFTEE